MLIQLVRLNVSLMSVSIERMYSVFAEFFTKVDPY